MNKRISLALLMLGGFCSNVFSAENEAKLAEQEQQLKSYVKCIDPSGRYGNYFHAMVVLGQAESIENALKNADKNELGSIYMYLEMPWQNLVVGEGKYTPLQSAMILYEKTNEDKFLKTALVLIKYGANLTN